MSGARIRAWAVGSSPAVDTAKCRAGVAWVRPRRTPRSPRLSASARRSTRPEPPPPVRRSGSAAQEGGGNDLATRCRRQETRAALLHAPVFGCLGHEWGQERERRSATKTGTGRAIRPLFAFRLLAPLAARLFEPELDAECVDRVVGHEMKPNLRPIRTRCPHGERKSARAVRDHLALALPLRVPTCECRAGAVARYGDERPCARTRDVIRRNEVPLFVDGSRCHMEHAAPADCEVVQAEAFPARHHEWHRDRLIERVGECRWRRAGLDSRRRNEGHTNQDDRSNQSADHPALPSPRRFEQVSLRTKPRSRKSSDALCGNRKHSPMTSRARSAAGGRFRGERWSLRSTDLAEVAAYCPKCDEQEFRDRSE